LRHRIRRQKLSCPVGQITGISLSSQEFKRPRPETGRGFFQSEANLNLEYEPVPSCRRNFGVRCILRRTRGNRNEQTACRRTDRRIIVFVRSESSGPCRRCCVGRGVRSGGFGTGGRGGRCVHWIYGGPRDRPFLGSRAVHIAIPGSACDAIKPRHATTSLCQGNVAAGCQTSRNGCRRKGRATRSGI
jgi:hypothetical protein